MSGKSLNLSARPHHARLTPDQERFQFLIAQLEKMRASRAALEAAIASFRQEYARKIPPLREALAKACRETVLALDRLLEQRGWSKPERATLAALLREMAQLLLEREPSDAEVKAAYDRHSTLSYDDELQQQLQDLKEQAEEQMGIDFGEDFEPRSEEDLVDRVYEEMKKREAEEHTRREKRAKTRKPSAAQQRAEESAQHAKQFLRELYRKLASAVHPDREQDPKRREHKNELMQKINRAYAANDLLTLFETQMQLENTDADHIARMGAARLQHYNKLLAQQLEQLKREIDDMKLTFRTEQGLDGRFSFQPQKIVEIVKRQSKTVREQVARQEHLVRVFSDKTAAKRWLKAQARYASGEFFDDFD